MPIYHADFLVLNLQQCRRNRPLIPTCWADFCDMHTWCQWSATRCSTNPQPIHTLHRYFMQVVRSVSLASTVWASASAPIWHSAIRSTVLASAHRVWPGHDAKTVSEFNLFLIHTIWSFSKWIWAHPWKFCYNIKVIKQYEIIRGKLQ